MTTKLYQNKDRANSIDRQLTSTHRASTHLHTAAPCCNHACNSTQLCLKAAAAPKSENDCRQTDYKQRCGALMKWLTALHFDPFSTGLSSKPHRLAPNVLLSCRCRRIGARSMPNTCCCRQSAGIEHGEHHTYYTVMCMQATKHTHKHGQHAGTKPYTSKWRAAHTHRRAITA